MTPGGPASGVPLAGLPAVGVEGLPDREADDLDLFRVVSRDATGFWSAKRTIMAHSGHYRALDREEPMPGRDNDGALQWV
jgi:hypothetical protein